MAGSAGHVSGIDARARPARRSHGATSERHVLARRGARRCATSRGSTRSCSRRPFFVEGSGWVVWVGGVALSKGFVCVKCFVKGKRVLSVLYCSCRGLWVK